MLWGRVCFDWICYPLCFQNPDGHMSLKIWEHWGHFPIKKNIFPCLSHLLSWVSTMFCSMAFYHFRVSSFFYIIFKSGFWQELPPIVNFLLLLNMEASFVFVCLQLKGFLTSFGSLCGLSSVNFSFTPCVDFSILCTAYLFCVSGFPQDRCLISFSALHGLLSLRSASE